MKSLSIPPGSSVKVVSFYDVETWSNQGWNVIGVIEEELIETGHELVPKPQNPNNNGYYDSTMTISLSKPFKVKHTKFVMVFATDDRIAAMQQQVADANLATEEARANAAALVKESSDNAKSLETVTAYFKKAESDLADANRRLQVAETTVQTLRKERYKFEKALGTLGVEQILSDQKFTGQVEVVSQEKVAENVPDRFNRVSEE